jgi:hypothetical protein
LNNKFDVVAHFYIQYFLIEDDFFRPTNLQTPGKISCITIIYHDSRLTIYRKDLFEDRIGGGHVIEMFIEEHRRTPHARNAEGNWFFPPAPFGSAKACDEDSRKNIPVYVEHKADCQQTTLEWFPQSSSREWTLHVIIEREEVADEPDQDVPDEAGKKAAKQEKGKKGSKGNGRAPKKEESQTPVGSTMDRT